MVLNIYKKQLDKLDLTAIANEFVSGSEYRLKSLLQPEMCTLMNIIAILTIVVSEMTLSPVSCLRNTFLHCCIL